MNELEVYQKAERIRDVIRYLRRFKKALVVIHLDDSIIDSPLFAGHMRDISLLHQAGLRIIIVPAARKRINEILGAYNISWRFETHTRVTSEDAMPLIKMAAFDVSNKVMSGLAAEKLTAMIGNWVRARGKGVIDGVDFATSGEIDRIQSDSIATILSNGFIPIFPCIGWSTSGKPYNISSVQLAAEVAVRMNADKLFFITKSMSFTPETCVIPQGIPTSSAGCIPALDLEEVASVIEINEKNHTADSQEMIHLLKLSAQTCKSGVSRVHILNGSIDGTIPCEIFSDLGSGTMIYEDNYGGIRDMKQQDISIVLTVMKPFIEKGVLLPRTEEQLFEDIHDYIVYEIDGRIHACAALHLYDDGQAEIAGVAVDQTSAHIGIGPKMLTFLIERARENHIVSVFVLTTQTADWFEQNGFISDHITSLPEKRKQKWSAQRASKVLRLSI